jgi:hypothetical protein
VDNSLHPDVATRVRCVASPTDLYRLCKASISASSTALLVVTLRESNLRYLHIPGVSFVVCVNTAAVTGRPGGCRNPLPESCHVRKGTLVKKHHALFLFAHVLVAKGSVTLDLDARSEAGDIPLGWVAGRCHNPDPSLKLLW